MFHDYYYYYTAYNAPCVGHEDDESRELLASPLPTDRLSANMTSSAKPEVHNVRLRRTEPRPRETCIENFAKFTRDFLRYAREQTGTLIEIFSTRVVSVLDSGAEGPGSNRSRDAVR